MESIQIHGGIPLRGEVCIQGSKNAALPVLAASVLVPGTTVIKNCPEISDVACMCEILKRVGAKVKKEQGTLAIDASSITEHHLPRDYMTRMRSSVVLAGAMLGRCREISFSFPGGCVIGDRPIDIHIQALKQLGAEFREDDDSIYACADRLAGARIVLPFPSVGATQNAVMAAVLAEGTTQIYRCAKEPEVTALCRFLNGAGAKITGAGSGHITVEGVSALRESVYEVEADRIVAGTYLTGVVAAGGEAFLRHAPSDQLEAVISLAQVMGARVRSSAEGLFIRRKGRLVSPGFVETGVYPAFPTDLQSPFLVALCQAEGESCLSERIFNGRFVVTDQLNRMGAKISVRKAEAFLAGSCKLCGSSVTAQELRGGAALVLAGICAEGVTFVYNRHFIDRGYEDIVRDLQSLGADIGSKEQ